MTNKLAIILGLVVVGLISADLYLNDGSELLFLGRKFLDLVNYIAFWR